MDIWIKNTDTVMHTWSGQGILQDEYYLIENLELPRWQNNSKLQTDIGSGIAIVAKDNSGNTDITDVNDAINYLKGNTAVEVYTQHEKTDIILRMACGFKESDANGAVSINVLVPGTPGSNGGRYIQGGSAWFDTFNSLDTFVVNIVDIDNIMAGGANAIVGTYTDDFSDYSANTNNDGMSGWKATPSEKAVSVESMGFFGFVPSGLYLVISGQKGDSTQENMHVNIKWGIKSA